MGEPAPQVPPNPLLGLLPLTGMPAAASCLPDTCSPSTPTPPNPILFPSALHSSPARRCNIQPPFIFLQRSVGMAIKEVIHMAPARANAILVHIVHLQAPVGAFYRLTHSGSTALSGGCHRPNNAAITLTTLSSTGWASFKRGVRCNDLLSEGTLRRDRQGPA